MSYFNDAWYLQWNWPFLCVRESMQDSIYYGRIWSWLMRFELPGTCTLRLKKKNPEIYNKHVTTGDQMRALGEVQVEHKHLDNCLSHWTVSLS